METALLGLPWVALPDESPALQPRGFSSHPEPTTNRLQKVDLHGGTLQGETRQKEPDGTAMETALLVLPRGALQMGLPRPTPVDVPLTQIPPPTGPERSISMAVPYKAKRDKNGRMVPPWKRRFWACRRACLRDPSRSLRQTHNLLCFSAPNQNEHRIGKKNICFPLRCSFWLLSAAVCKTVCFPMTDLLFA